MAYSPSPTETRPATSFLDLAWHHAGGDVWAAQRTRLFDATYECAVRGMAKVGIEATGAIVAWDLSRAPDADIVDKRFSSWERVGREELARWDARDAARRPVPIREALAAQASLKSMAEAAPWAFGDKGPEAYSLSRRPTLTPAQLHFATHLAREAGDRYRAVTARLEVPADEDAIARSEGDERRADLHDACRLISAQDEDRAQDRNGVGWDSASSWKGHHLALRVTLTPLEAAHAWTLVERHRRQLPADLRARLGL